MDITYLGHSAFKLKGREASVVTDPYDKKMTGFAMPQVSADIVTVSHEHEDHNAVKLVSSTSRRTEAYVVKAPGEYEVSGVGVFGWGSFHDDKQGEERGKNTIYSILIDGVRVVHLGDLGTIIADDLVENLGTVDVLMIPVGGKWTIGPKEAVMVVEKLSPSIVVPMHFKTSEYSDNFEGLAAVDEFAKLMGVTEFVPEDKLKVSQDSLPETTQLIVMTKV